MAVRQLERPAVNPGPSWGYSAIVFFDRWLPRPLFDFVVSIGVWIGLVFMPKQRRNSQDYLTVVSGARPGVNEIYRHYRTFTESLITKLTLEHRGFPEFVFSELSHEQAFRELCASPQQVLFGTFHVGYSDMIGCLLTRFDRKVSLVRLKVGNSLDTDMLGRLFAGQVNFIWINEPEEFLFSIKSAVERGESLALQCDRIDAGGRQEPFQFLGKKRLFPMTIYFLSSIFNMPVVFSFTGPAANGQPISVFTSPVFHPQGSQSSVLEAGRIHFQEVLFMLESHLHKYPNLWFNFLPLNPAIDE